MIVLLRDLDGKEYRLGVADGRFVDPEEALGPVRDFRAHYALSGLADCHTHLSGDGVQDMVEYDGAEILAKMRRNSVVQLENGVLLLVDKGAKFATSLQFLDGDASDRPHLQMAGRMIAVADGYYPDFCTEVEDDLDAVIAAAVSGGATWVKLVGDWPRRGRGPVTNFGEAELRRVVAIAHAAGCRVAIHTAAPETPSLAVRAGVDSIEHGLFLTAEDLAMLGERGGAWVPTIAAMESTAGLLGPVSSGGRMFAAGLDNVRSLLDVAIAAGVAVLAGTDLALPHGAVAREAERLVAYGLSAPLAVDATSTAAYTYVGMPAGFAVGMPADVVLYPGDPRRDITELQRPAHVMRAGREVFSSL